MVKFDRFLIPDSIRHSLFRIHYSSLDLNDPSSPIHQQVLRVLQHPLRVVADDGGDAELARAQSGLVNRQRLAQTFGHLARDAVRELPPGNAPGRALAVAPSGLPVAASKRLLK